MTTTLDACYVPRVASRSRTIEVRRLSCHLREWGPPGAPTLLLLHGARDSSATFQFLVDALQGDWHVVAPDWRGHGQSEWTPGSYWQAEFVADLDTLLDILALETGSPARPALILGHSMGGNVASLYAGIRPARVARLVMLDALGELLHRTPVKVDEILELVLDARNAGDRAYPQMAGLADRLRRQNRRLGAAEAMFLATTNARALSGGGFGWLFDPSFKRSLPNMHTRDDWATIWRGITAPVLGVMSSDPRPNAPASDPEEAAWRRACFRDLQHVTVPDTGHNLHHDAPGAVARAIETFL